MDKLHTLASILEPSCGEQSQQGGVSVDGLGSDEMTGKAVCMFFCGAARGLWFSRLLGWLIGWSNAILDASEDAVG